MSRPLEADFSKGEMSFGRGVRNNAVVALIVAASKGAFGPAVVCFDDAVNEDTGFTRTATHSSMTIAANRGFRHMVIVSIIESWLFKMVVLIL